MGPRSTPGSRPEFQVGIAPMPAGASGSKTWSDGSGFGVTKDCKNPDEAFQAVSVMVGDGRGEVPRERRPRLPRPDLNPELLVRGQQDPGRQAGHGRRLAERGSVHHDSDLAAGRDHRSPSRPSPRTTARGRSTTSSARPRRRAVSDANAMVGAGSEPAPTSSLEGDNDGCDAR